MARYYVGFNNTGNKAAEIFRAETEPTPASHGHLYAAVWGPFRTKRGATFGASWRARGNPHAQTVADVERIAATL